MSVPADRINTRTATKAHIKRASRQARAAANRIDKQALTELSTIYERAVAGLQRDIRAYASTDGGIRLEVLQDLLAQANGRLSQLELARNRLLDEGLVQSAQAGIRPFTADAAILSTSLTRIADEAVQFTHNFIHADGLQLSDRLWRVDRQAREVVGQAIESAVIQGHSASRAASDFLGRGQPVPADIASKIGIANAGNIAKSAGSALMKGGGSPRANALRVFRTEINRAHGEAYQAAAFAHPDAAGTRFLLSPRHPEADICDMHARVNRYGLGPGVYPQGKTPWPAHPNTLSYTEIVFIDEIAAEDRAGKENRIDWLQKQPPDIQEAVLASRKKRAALQRGLLKETQIATPWKVLKVRYKRLGIDVDGLTVTPLAKLPSGSGVVGSRTPSEVRTDALRFVLERGESTGHEHVLGYDVRSGTQYIKSTTRSKGQVLFTRHELALLHDPKNRIDVVHNHPGGTSLSLSDLRIGTLPGVERVTAYGHDGSLYSARSLISADELTSASKNIERYLDGEIRGYFNRGKLSGHQASALYPHVHNFILDRAGAIEYSVERVDGLLRSTLDAFDEREIARILNKASQRGYS